MMALWSSSKLHSWTSVLLDMKSSMLSSLENGKLENRPVQMYMPFPDTSWKEIVKGKKLVMHQFVLNSLVQHFYYVYSSKGISFCKHYPC